MGQGEYAEWYWNRIDGKPPADARGTRGAITTRNYGAQFKYQDFAPKFTAELFDANEWADLFRRSGAKYVVPTSKHHEGFCLWPSAEAETWGRPWNTVEIGRTRPDGRPPNAVRAQGLKFGFYYSLYEWYNPFWLTDKAFVAST